MNLRQRLCWIALCLSLAGGPVAADQAGNANSELPPPSAEARWYLQYALNIMQEHSINRASIDWPRFRASVMEQARGAVTVADTHPVLRNALAGLGDGHSFLRTERRPDDERRFADWPRERNSWFIREPRAEVIGERFAYIALPGFFRGTHEVQQDFAGRVQRDIGALDADGVCGWIVDLRGNAGGNLWPMLAGIGPLLGDGEVASAVYPDGSRTPVWYRNGQAGFGDYVQLRVRGEPYSPSVRDAPAAVLLGPTTASSGETVAIAFRGRTNARSFGASTRGVSTGNRTFELSDGAMMALTVASSADRNGRIYGGAVDPDEPADIGSADQPLMRQPVVQAALAWLSEQSGCR